MSNLADYLAFIEAHPDLFVNPTHGGITLILNKADIQAVEAQMAQKLEAAGKPAAWAQVGIIVQDQYVTMLRDAVCFPDGTTGTYFRFIRTKDTPPGVIVLPVYHNRILLIRHFRHSTRRWHLEIPRGYGDRNFSNQNNALRELKEEIGASVSRLVSLGQLHPNTGTSMDCDELYYADVEAYGIGDTHEAIDAILPTSVAAFEQMIGNNEITDGFTIAAYTRAKIHGLL
jgi:ADP-ribose pyrophosphatase